MDAQVDDQSKEGGVIQGDVPTGAASTGDQPPAADSVPSGVDVKIPQAEISADAGELENPPSSGIDRSISGGGDSSSATAATSSNDVGSAAGTDGDGGSGNVAAQSPSTSRSSSLNAAAPVFVPSFSVPAVAGQPAVASHPVGFMPAAAHQLMYAGALLPLPHAAAAPGGAMPPGGAHAVHLPADGAGLMTWMPVDASAGLLPYPAAAAAVNGSQVAGAVAGHHGRKGHGGKHGSGKGPHLGGADGYVGAAAVQSGLAGDAVLTGLHGGEEHDASGEAAGEGEEHKEGEGGRGGRKRGKGKKADTVALSESELAAVKEKMKQQVRVIVREIRGREGGREGGRRNES